MTQTSDRFSLSAETYEAIQKASYTHSCGTPVFDATTSKGKRVVLELLQRKAKIGDYTVEAWPVDREFTDEDKNVVRVEETAFRAKALGINDWRMAHHPLYRQRHGGKSPLASAYHRCEK